MGIEPGLSDFQSFYVFFEDFFKYMLIVFPK